MSNKTFKMIGILIALFQGSVVIALAYCIITGNMGFWWNTGFLFLAFQNAIGIFRILSGMKHLNCKENENRNES